MRRDLQREEGQAAILVAIAAAALMGLAALGVDLGRLYNVKARLTAAADAAALAGVTALPQSPDLARELALTYLERNGVAAGLAEVAVSTDRRRIAVRVSKAERMTFAAVLGFREQTVVTEVEAAKENLSGAYGVVPMGVVQGNFSFGERVTLKLGSGSCCAAPGNFQALSLGGNRGANAYRYYLEHGYPDWIRIGDELETEPGNMSGPTRQGIANRLAADPAATWQTVSRRSPRILTVPVLSPFPNGRGKIEVLAFAVFFLEEPEPGEEDEVVGRFMEWIVDGEQSAEAPDYGAWAIRLSR